LTNKITYKQFGENAILIEWKPIIDKNILSDIITYKEKILQSDLEYLDIIQSYNSLTILFNFKINNVKNKIFKLQSIYSSTLEIEKKTLYKWEIPVCYDLDFGIDLQEISNKLKISIDKIIKLHTAPTYTIFFIGFLPGFFYLGGLDKKLFFDRKSTPRLHVDKGTVAIGGMQTGIYPNNSAGGWNIIGKTPIDLFNANKENPCFAKAGDEIKFRSISKEEFYQIEKDITVNVFKIHKTLKYD